MQEPVGERYVSRRPAVRAARPAAAWLVALLSFLCAVPATPLPPDGARHPARDLSGPARIAIRPELPAPEDAIAPGLEAPGDPQADGGAQPSVQYRHAAAHVDDRLAFKPGARVNVPFQPRADDHWQIDGQPPLALPAGDATGQQMRDGTHDLSTFLDQPIAPAVPADAISAAGSAKAPEHAPTAVAGSTGLGREVFGFLPYWELSDSSTVLDWPTLSTIAYFSVGCTSSGGLWKRDADGSISTGWAGWTSAKMTSIIERAHEHGTRVVLTVTCFAWSNRGASAQASVLGSATARATLARQVAAAVRNRGADGVNLDFEPILPGYAEEFTALVREVRRELSAIAPGYQLTFDAMATIGDQPIAEATAPGGADAVVIMGYDYRTARSSVAGSISPLRGPGYDLTDTVDAFTAETDASKVILAVPYYGRAWSTTTSQLHSPTLDPGTYGAAAEPYYDQAAELAAIHGRRYDRVEESPWAAYRKKVCIPGNRCLTTWRQMYFDDAASLQLRYHLINQAGLRGVGIWALGFDGERPELRAALAASFIAVRTSPVVTVPERVPGDRILVRWRSWEADAIQNYDVEVSVDGGTFDPWLTDTQLTSSTMLSTSGRTYAFRVRTTDVDGNTSAWQPIPLDDGRLPDSLATGGFGRVVVDGLRLRSSPSLSGEILMLLNAGTSLQVVGGQVRRDGYRWYEVAGLVRQSDSVDSMLVRGWVAAYGNGWTHVVPRRPIYPRATTQG
jgi:spore germination protein YaaH